MTAKKQLSDLDSKTHLLTVAVEDYFHHSAFGGLFGETTWARFETHVAPNTRRTLDLLDEHGVKATFFVLGWVAERMPEVIREIAERGHEVASKGYYHRNLEQMTRDEFREDVRQTRDAIERATRKRVLGHRVAQGTLRLENLWALDILAQEGFAYDSSLFPRMRSLGSEAWRRFPHEHRAGDKTIWELPLSTHEVSGLLVPVAGGNYYRQFPFALMKRAFEHWEAHYDAPFNMYFHVWELDPDLPRISAAGPLTRIRQYRNLDKMRWVLPKYFAEHRFESIAQHLGLVQDDVSPKPRSEPRAVAIDTSKARIPITIVVPCYNEERVLPFLANTLNEVTETLGASYEIHYLFVDDGSRDATREMLLRLFGARPECRVVAHEKNSGVAAAIMTGIREAKTEIVCSIDADCTYDPRQLKELIPKLTPDVDMVTASPYHPDGGVRNVPAYRLFLSKSVSRLYRHVLHHRFFTYTSCFRVYRRSSLVPLVIEEGGFLGVTETLGKLDLAGGHVVECPAVLEVRMLGRSKMQTARAVAGHLKLLARLAVARHRGPEVDDHSTSTSSVNRPPASENESTITK